MASDLIPGRSLSSYWVAAPQPRQPHASFPLSWVKPQIHRWFHKPRSGPTQTELSWEFHGYTHYPTCPPFLEEPGVVSPVLTINRVNSRVLSSSSQGLMSKSRISPTQGPSNSLRPCDTCPRPRKSTWVGVTDCPEKGRCQIHHTAGVSRVAQHFRACTASHPWTHALHQQPQMAENCW